jgi:hypothetical protein
MKRAERLGNTSHDQGAKDVHTAKDGRIVFMRWNSSNSNYISSSNFLHASTH